MMNLIAYLTLSSEVKLYNANVKANMKTLNKTWISTKQGLKAPWYGTVLWFSILLIEGWRKIKKNQNKK